MNRSDAKVNKQKKDFWEMIAKDEPEEFLSAIGVPINEF